MRLGIIKGTSNSLKRERQKHTVQRMDRLSVHYYQRKEDKEVEESEGTEDRDLASKTGSGRKIGNLGREGAKIGSLLGIN